MMRSMSNPASWRETQAQRALAGIWKLAEVQLALALSLAQEIEAAAPSADPEESTANKETACRRGGSRRQRQDRLALISGTLAEINEQIEEALSSDNREI